MSSQLKNHRQIENACQGQKRQSVRLKNVGWMSLSLLWVFVLFSAGTLAQAEKLMTDNLSVGLELKNMHLWHGSVVTPGVMMASNMTYASNDKRFIVGLWGGASFNGDYKEFSYFSKYNFTSSFYAELVSHNNYSNQANPDIFSYDKYRSPNFLDLAVGYNLAKGFPLSIYWSTILFGQGGDYEFKENGTATNSYSNYVELSYPIFKDEETELIAFAGGAFSFLTEKTFYSEKANLLNIGVTLNHSVRLFSARLPVSGTAFWNPETKVGALQLGIALF